MELYQWDAVENEALNPLISRRAIYTPQLTVARLFLKKGAVVPEHSHIHEQVSSVESGALKFTVNGREQVVKAGDALVLGSKEPHSVIALEDTHVLDVFSPAREDWRSGDDAYLRR